MKTFVGTTLIILSLNTSIANAAQLGGTILQTTSSTPINWSFKDDELTSEFNIDGTDIKNTGFLGTTYTLADFRDANGQPLTSIKGDWWEITNIKLFFDDSTAIVFLDEDKISIDYTIHHFKPPHTGEGVGSDLVVKDLEIAGKLPTNVPYSVRKRDLHFHGEHIDTLNAVLTATSSGGIGQDISSWNFKAKTKHIPEPFDLGAGALVGLGLLGLRFKIKMAKASSKQKD